MPESADLLAAVAAAPADDLPRLVYADWLDDRGEPDHATFVRDQIRLAQVPSWDPLAVRARHQRKETLGIGRPFYGTLPELPLFLKWHPEKAFRRGFGTGVVVNQLSGLIEAGQQLFDLAPVDELWLGAASLDEWRTVARSPWLKNIRKVHLHFSQGLHEPIRCLAESPYSGNIDEIWFDTLATPAAGAVIEILAQSPLAKQLTGLHMRLVHTPSLPEVIAALAGGQFEKLERFSMVQAGLDYDSIDMLAGSNFYSRLRKVDLSYNFATYLNNYAINQTLAKLTSVEYLSIDESNVSLYQSNQENKSWLKQIRFISLRSINRSRVLRFSSSTMACNSIFPKCLIVARNQLDALYLKDLLWWKVWDELCEFDYSGNILTNRGSNCLLEGKIPTFLTSIVLSRSRVSQRNQNRLESHFGDRLVWAADDATTGLAR